MGFGQRQPQSHHQAHHQAQEKSKSDQRRWKKGQACLSNPAGTRFRDAARLGFHAAHVPQPPTPKLTQHALEALQEELSENEENGDSEDNSTAHPAAGAFVGGFPAVFADVVRKRQSTVAAHREESAVLAVMQEIVKSQNVDESETSYFAALVTALEEHVASHTSKMSDGGQAAENVSDSDDAMEGNEEGDEDVEGDEVLADIDVAAATAIGRLLSLVLPAVRPAVLLSKFDMVAQVFGSACAAFSDKDHSAVVRNILACIPPLTSVLTAADWNRRPVLQLYQVLLSYATDERAKTRKRAHESIEEVLKQASNYSGHDLHPAAAETAKHCLPFLKVGLVSKQQQQPAQRRAGKKKAETISEDLAVTLHILGLFKRITAMLPSAAVKGVCEGVLRLLGSAHAVSVQHSLETLDALIEASEYNNLTPELTAQVFMALLEYQPAVFDVNPSIAWIHLMVHACARLARTQPSLALDCVARLVERLVPLLIAERREVSSCASAALQALFQKCLTTHSLSGEDVSVEARTARVKLRTELLRLAAAASKAKDLAAEVQNNALLGSIAALEAGLGYRYQAVWQTVLECASVLLRSLGRAGYPCTSGLLKAVVNLHSKDLPQCRSAVEETVGAAMEGLGAPSFFSIIPLDNFGTLDAPALEFPRAWMFPLLRTHIKNTRLAHFATVLIPLSERFLQIVDHYQQLPGNGNQLIATTYRRFYDQVWDFFPGYCTWAVDVAEALPSFAKTLGQLLNQQPSIRLAICQGLQQLVAAATADTVPESTLAEPPSVAARKGAAQVLGLYAKNFLPILFNNFTLAHGDARSVISDTIFAYVKVADSALTSSLFRNVLKKLLAARTTNTESSAEDAAKLAEERHVMMDLALALLHSLDNEALALLYRVVGPQLQSEDSTLQKKSYKALLIMLESTNEKHVALVKQQLPDIQTLVTDALVTTSAAAKRNRLRCIGAIVQHVDANTCGFIPECLPEVMLSTKEVSDKTRRLSFDLLVSMGETMKRLGEEGISIPTEDGAGHGASVSEFFRMTCAGLAGTTPHMISAAIRSLSRLIFEFRADLEQEMIDQVLESVLLMMESKSREVIDSAFGFIKVCISVLPPDMMKRQLPTLLKYILHWSTEAKNRFKQKVKVILERLIRKQGYDYLDSIFPEEHRRFIVNIRKVKERGQRKRREAKEAYAQNAVATGTDYATRMKAQRAADFDQALYGSEDEDDDEGDHNDDRQHSNKHQRSGAAPASKTWIRDETEQDGPLDFLGTDAARKVVSSKPAPRRANETKTNFRISEDGRMVIENSDEEMEVDEQVQDEEPEETPRLKGKRKHELVGENDEDEDDVRNLARAAASARYKKHHQSDSSQHSKRAKVAFGNEYKSKKAGGDVKRRNMPDPYAYVPLNIKDLNRRKKTKGQGKFEGIVKGAKKGAAAKRARR